jgi:hypothetical protein
LRIALFHTEIDYAEDRVKRAIGTVLAIALLAGMAFAAQMMTRRAPAQTGTADSGAVSAILSTGGLHHLPEPISIVLSSLILLGGTTVLRRARMNRGA